MREYMHEILINNSYFFLYLIGIEFFLDKKKLFLNKKEIILFIGTPIFYKLLSNNTEINFSIYFLLFLILAIFIKYKIDFLTLPFLMLPFLLVENNTFFKLTTLILVYIIISFFIKEIIKEIKTKYKKNSYEEIYLIIFAIISIIIAYL
ncbi:hypothetical protein EV215_1519 [Hypnocyclicus thermotrophus]|uniref:Uncharacterized protein n=1 Tax=Hypnocyclicus thermotrophus TaxID=1627895 RepID=A0AA46DXY2_9FUSO|nr:hypothetical protein [Hypnocyclicus thermotrophus]TDT69177.1 hypothetical protein EV215_1519 [Hypnocyclicus thermotrophus]